MPRKPSKLKKLQKECEDLMYEVAFRFYGKKCEICNASKDLIVHHFIPRKLCKSLIYELLNFVVLCKKCHFELHKRQNPFIILKIASKRGKKWIEYLETIFKEKRGTKSPSQLSFLSDAKSYLSALLRQGNKD